MVNLINDLRMEFDDIIIDTPPLHMVTDALILARLSDVTFYLVRQGFTDKSELEFIKKVHKEQMLPNLNLIFNSIDRNRYGYGYNYSSYNKTIKKKKTVKQMVRSFAGRL